MMKEVRWGLLSTANINKFLIPAIRASERGDLRAVASRSAASAEAYAQRWEIPLAFGSYEAMLGSDAVDAVYISLPNHLHVPWTITALRHGKHVLCEKPFALKLEDVDRVLQVMEETGNKVTEAFMYRHHPQTKLAGQLIRDGKLGDISVVRGVFNFKLTDSENVRLVPEWGGGALWDVGCYPVSIAQYFMGSAPEWVFGDQILGATGVDIAFAGQMRYAGDRMAQFTAAFRTPFHAHVEVLGTEGRLVLTEPFRIDLGGNRMLFYPAEGEPQELQVPTYDLYLGEVEDLNGAILDGREPYLSLAETRDHVRTLLALYESAAARKPVHLA